MATVISLNQITKLITAFAENHGQLNAASFGIPLNLAVQGETLYPAFYYVLANARKEKNELHFFFKADLSDRVYSEKTNETEVWSDMLLVATDILGFLDSDERDFVLVSSSAITPFTEEGGDLLAGVQFDFTLKVPFPYDRCIAPKKTGGGDFNSDFNNDFSGGIGSGTDEPDFNNDFNNDFGNTPTP